MDSQLREAVMRSIALDLKGLERDLAGRNFGFGVPANVEREAGQLIEQLRELLAEAPIVLRNREVIEQNMREMRYQEGVRQLHEHKKTDWAWWTRLGLLPPTRRSKARTQLRAEVEELYRAGPA